MIWSISGECSKNLQRVNHDWFSSDFQKLFCYVSAHPGSLSGCQDNRSVFFFFSFIFSSVFYKYKNSAADLSSPFCCGSFFFLSFSKLQVRYGIQVPAVAGSLLVLVVSCHTDHGRIVGTEDRGRTVKADALFFHMLLPSPRGVPRSMQRRRRSPDGPYGNLWPHGWHYPPERPQRPAGRTQRCLLRQLVRLSSGICSDGLKRQILRR